MSKWRTIQTMPLDVPVLVYHPDGDLIEIRHRPSDRPDSLYPGGASIGFFSHWRKLPAKPGLAE